MYTALALSQSIENHGFGKQGLSKSFSTHILIGLARVDNLKVSSPINMQASGAFATG